MPNKKNSTKILKMSVKNPSHLYISLNQPDKRQYPNIEDFNLSYLRLFIANIQQKTMEFIGGFHGIDKFLTFDSKFETGSYLILIEIKSPFENKSTLVIDVYGEIPVEFEELERSSSHDFFTIQSDLIRSYCKILPRNKNLEENDFSKKGCREIRRFFGEIFGIGFLYYVNNSNDFEIIENIEVKNQKKLII